MNFLVLAAAGSGSRFGSSIPKQFASLADRPLYQHSLEVIRPVCASGVIVVPADWVSRIQRELAQFSWGVQFRVVAGGETRQESVWHGLQDLPDSNDLVLVHDAARPYVSSDLVRRILAGAAQYQACVPGLVPADTIKEVTGSRVARTLDRTRLRAIQTPQGFRLRLLKTAFEKAIKEGFVGTDEAAVVERTGAAVEVVPGEAGNVKITWPEDLEINLRD